MFRLVHIDSLCFKMELSASHCLLNSNLLQCLAGFVNIYPFYQIAMQLMIMCKECVTSFTLSIHGMY